MSAQIKAEPLGKCPCGQDIYASVESFAVIHSLPYCDEFKNLEPHEFLAFVRRSRGLSETGVPIQ